ncbi:MAG: serine hydrolase domain-containing protein [Thiotrichaceae bacterium]
MKRKNALRFYKAQSARRRIMVVVARVLITMGWLVGAPAFADRIQVVSHSSTLEHPLVKARAPAQDERDFRTEGCSRLTRNEEAAAEGLADRIKERIAHRVKGYSIAVAKDCRLAATLAGGVAVTAVDTGDAPDLMTVAHRSAMGSVAKLITAVTIVQELEAQGIDPDSSITPYLEMFWDLDEVGYKAELSWTNLLNQTSGINSSSTTSELAYGYLGEFLSTADAEKGFKYDNANAGILRVLLWGLVSGSAPAGNADQIEASTAQYFQMHVRDFVFSPISIDDAWCAPDGATSHAYQYAAVDATNGWLPTTSQAMEWCGPGGWFLSSVELVKLAVYLRHTDLLMSFDMRDRLDADRLGWDTPTDGWPAILKPGKKRHIRFKAGENGGRSCVMDFMNGTEVAVVINSADLSGPALCDAVATAYYDPGVWQ